MDLSIVYSLSKFFIAAGLCYVYRSSLTFARGLGFRCDRIARDTTIANSRHMKPCTTSMKMDNIGSDNETYNSPVKEMMSDTCSAAKVEQLGQEYQTFMSNEKFEKFCKTFQNASDSDDLSPLEYVKNFTAQGSLSTPIYLLGAAVDMYNSGKRQVNPQVTEMLVEVGNNILELSQEHRLNSLDLERPPLCSIAGSNLLQVLDTFALNISNITSHPITDSNKNKIGFLVRELTINNFSDADRIHLSPIEDHSVRISLPKEVLKGVAAETPVRLASFLFRNLSGLLPESLRDGAQNDTSQDDRVLRLASPIISASFQCENCTLLNLSTPVEITFEHCSYDEALLENDKISGTTKCVFWEFENNQCQESTLFTGQWSTEGCETTFNSTFTTCRCNHLSHFAILLSAQPLTNDEVLSQTQVLALQITGYIGVSLSLVAMAATTFVFVFLKALRTMRNYIHIQLCVTLGIAQIIFVAGVEPHLGEGGGVPIGCRSVAVLLHYWFLVSFMWMLMEGVVLYVVLVRVFIKFHGRYIAAFTITSYGLPLIYVGALTVPLGFVRTDYYRKDDPYDYGYEQACYLSPHTSFIWSLLVPVMLIFLANIGFFIMAIAVIYRHQKKQNIGDKKHQVKHWIKVSISLTVVMGITWIIGFLVIEVEALFTLAYIFTIFVAFQGVFIFVIFVLFSKQVKENYTKWWKAKVAESDFLSKHFGSKLLTSGTSLNNNVTPPAATGKQSSNSGISSKVFENTNEEQKLAVESLYYDQKSGQ